MVESNIAKELGLEPSTDYKSKDIEKLFKERQDDRVELLKESIADINHMIKDREDLNKELFENIDKIDMFINDSMPKPGADTKGDLMKELLKKKVEIQELKIQEKLNFWRDIATLKKELREHMKEYRDMESKTSMLGNLLEE